MAHVRSDVLPNAMPRDEFVPYVKEALNRYPTFAFTTGELFRVADSLLVGAGEPRFASSQLTRVTLMFMVDNGQSDVHRRTADEHDHPSLLRYGATIWLASATHPVPVWTPNLEILLREDGIAKARINPLHNRTGAPKGRSHAKKIGGQPSDRAALVVSLIQEMAADLDAAADAPRQKLEMARLEAENERLRNEVTETNRRLAKIVKAQRTLAELLGAPQAD